MPWLPPAPGCLPAALQSLWEGYAAILQRAGLRVSRLDLLGAVRELAMGGVGAVVSAASRRPAGE